MSKNNPRPFLVIDAETGEEANVKAIARNEEWAKALCSCDMEGFFIGQDGELILADECGNYAFCDKERFQVTFLNK